jgi:uncharacterized protein YjdB
LRYDATKGEFTPILNAAEVRRSGKTQYTLSSTPVTKEKYADCLNEFNASNPKVGALPVKAFSANEKAYLTAAKFKQLAGAYYSFSTVKTIKLAKTSLSLTAGGSYALSVRRSPSTAISDTLSFTSSNTAVATVDGNGNVQALAAGKSTITVMTSRGAKSGCALTVTLPAPTGVTLTNSALTLTRGERATLGGTVAPALADQSLSYTSSNDKVVSITPDGAMTALSSGKASITVSTVNGIKTSCTVVVNDRPAVIVDISQHNYSTSMDWKKIAQNVDLLILRCGVTRTDTDPVGIGRDFQFEYYVQQCRAYDIPFGVYYYGKCSDAETAAKEAEMTWAIAGRFNPLFYVYDAEEARLTRAVIETYISTLKSLGADRKSVV